MGLYDRFVLPHVVHFTCAQKPQRRQRRKVVPLASGTVLEIGFGSGLNLPFYDPSRVDRVLALEPSVEMLRLARELIEASPIPVEPMAESAERIPLDDRTVDTVLLTYTLCTIPDAAAALLEAKRVLRSDGTMIFCEHGEAPDSNVLRWQRRLNPLWRRLGGGCHLDRPIPDLIRAGGFEIVELETMYLPGWRPASFNFWGRARTA